MTMVKAIDYQEFAPEKDYQTDKYSWNIFRYLRKHKGHVRVFKKRHEAFEACNLIITHQTIYNDYDGLAGWRVPRLTAAHNSLRSSVVYSGKYIDVTERFFNTYKELGYCFLFPDHSCGFYTGWDETPRTRVCKNCGLKQRKKIYTVKREKWVNVS